jgi:phosphoribosyl-AMP cyclohydrolase
VIDQVKFDEKGLVTAVVQDCQSNELLMVGYMNQLALERTLKERKMVYWSRSRQQFWVKGERSGHTQTVRAVRIDCDGDALLFKVEQKGGACHTGYRSCFYRQLDGQQWKTDQEKVFDPDKAYKNE